MEIWAFRELCANPEKGDFCPFGQVYPEKSDLLWSITRKKVTRKHGNW